MITISVHLDETLASEATRVPWRVGWGEEGGYVAMQHELHFL